MGEVWILVWGYAPVAYVSQSYGLAQPVSNAWVLAQSLWWLGRRWQNCALALKGQE
jgi:hypothetical protein